MAYTLRTGPFVQTVGNFDTLAELNSGHPATQYNPGTHAFTVDNGAVYSDGTTWRSYSMGTASGASRVLAQQGVPLVAPSTGSAVSSAGVVTGLTAMARSSGNCYGVLPAGYLSSAGAGSAAGVYYGQIQSTTSITFFNNLLTSGPTVAITSPTAFSGLSGGNFTQVTSAQTALTIPVPANGMGANGRFRARFGESNNNSAGAKTFVLQWAGSTVISAAPTTNQTNAYEHDLANQGVTNSQVSQPAGLIGLGNTAGAPLTFAADTTAANNITLTLQLAVATDWMQIDWLYVELYPG